MNGKPVYLKGINMLLIFYEEEFRNLRPNRSHGHTRPHKMIMLLSVIDLIEQGVITENKIYYSNSLTTTFTKHFNLLKKGNDDDTSFNPFYYLRSSGFWHHQIYESKSEQYNALKSSISANKVKDAINYVYLDPELFELLKSEIARDCLKNALAENYDEDLREQLLNPARGWAWNECEIIVEDYFNMLESELRAEKYNKAEHNRNLQTLLKARSRASIENKHQNISAIIKEMGLPIIDGYKPLVNYQRKILPDVVGAFLAHKPNVLTLIEQLNQNKIISARTTGSILNSLVDAPERRISDPKGKYNPTYKPIKKDYLAQETKNRELGLAGEEFILNYEKARLEDNNRSSLSDKIEHISLNDDSAGFDIHSYEKNGKDRFIEVKTTRYDRYSQFFVSSNEVKTSKKYEKKYFLYRVFNFDKQSQFFYRKGDIEKNFQLQANSYRAMV